MVPLFHSNIRNSKTLGVGVLDGHNKTVFIKLHLYEPETLHLPIINNHRIALNPVKAKSGLNVKARIYCTRNIFGKQFLSVCVIMYLY